MAPKRRKATSVGDLSLLRGRGLGLESKLAVRRLAAALPAVAVFVFEHEVDGR